MTFGKMLQRIRRDKNMTQREVAQAIDMDYSYFSRLENDRFDSNPTRETIDKIAEALGCIEEERRGLLAAAGRMDEELEKAARIAGERPALGKLFRAAVRLPLDRIEELADQVESEIEEARKHNRGRR